MAGLSWVSRRWDHSLLVYPTHAQRLCQPPSKQHARLHFALTQSIDELRPAKPLDISADIVRIVWFSRRDFLIYLLGTELSHDIATYYAQSFLHSALSRMQFATIPDCRFAHETLVVIQLILHKPRGTT